MAIRSKLNFVLEPLGQVGDEAIGVLGVPPAEVPAWDHLGISIQGDPRPDIPIPDLALVLVRDVLLLGVAKGPDLITLNPTGGQAPEGSVLVGGASLTDLPQEPEDGALGCPGHAAGGLD